MSANIALVVDDSSTDLTNLTSILQEVGWQVRTATNGVHALEQVKRDRPRIIFLDIVMPELDGYGTSRELFEDPLTRAIPVVFVSTKNSRANQVWARAQGGKALIGKPFSADEIISALRFAE